MARPRFWTDEKQATLLTQWDAGVLARLIGEKLGVTEGAVKRRVYDLRVPQRDRVRHPEDWPAARVETLKVLWAQGFSAAQVGLQLNLTRNAVIGKVHRLKLAARGDAWKGLNKSEGGARPRKRKEPRPQNPPRHKLPEPVSVNPLNLTFSDLMVGQCRYPTTADHPFLFCAHDIHPGSSYCPFHHNLCWVKPRRHESNKPVLPSLMEAA